MKKHLVQSLVFVVLISGCIANKPYTAHLVNQSVQPASLMVAKPLPRTLFVVVDPKKVADSFPITNSIHSVTGFKPFMETSMKKALSSFFQQIKFVSPTFSAPDEPYIVADVKVDGIEAYSMVTGPLTYEILKMHWAFALRPSESDEYLFSFAGVAQSELSYAILDEGCQQLMKSALHGLLESWTEKEVYKKLREVTSSSPQQSTPQ